MPWRDILQSALSYVFIFQKTFLILWWRSGGIADGASVGFGEKMLLNYGYEISKSLVRTMCFPRRVRKDEHMSGRTGINGLTCWIPM